MQYSLSGTVLSKDLVTADGRVVGARGQIVGLAYLKALAARAPRGGRELPLFDTPLAESVLEAFDASPLQNLMGGESSCVLAADALAEVRFPQAIWDELEALRKEDEPRYQHAIWSAVIAAHLFRAAMGSAPGIARLVGGALTHDLGMRHAAGRLRFKREHLTRAEALSLEDHPLLGALLLASVLGDAPAVHLALLHHSRGGFSYGRAGGEEPPLRELDLISVASAFAALIAPRSYRLQPYNPRGAVDQLLDDAMAGQFDLRAIRLLIRCLRGAKAQADLRFPAKPTGFRPPVNHHGVSRASSSI
jgi:HD-GYP domain-containing protein (c-di-GMP phosphodiesterase class II)